MHRIQGGCHCGNLTYAFEASTGLEELGLRACLCSFCRIHGARTTSDPKGDIRISVRRPERLLRYRFGLKTADFFICAECGAFIGAVLKENGPPTLRFGAAEDSLGARRSFSEGGRQWMTVNANTFRPPPPLDFPTVPHDFEGEGVPGRIKRRMARWTPLSAIEGA